MALPDPIIPYGLSDVHVAALDPADDTAIVGSWVDLPVAQKFSFSEEEDFEQLRGDDKIKTERGKGPTVAWDLDEGGISFPAYKIMVGGTIAASGTTPALKKSLKKKVTHQRPYFAVRGQVITDDGGDMHCRVFKCKTTGSVQGEFADAAFEVTSMSGTGYGNSDDDLYEFVQHETPIAVDDDDA